MPKLPIISGKKAIEILEKDGYFVIRTKGSHFQLSHSEKKSITIPIYKTLDRGTLRKIIRDAEISVSDFIRLMRK